jgi:hypothetical protein
MNLSRALLFLLILAALGAGEEKAATEPKEIESQLAAARPDEASRLGYHAFRPVVVESTVPRFLFQIPEFRAKDPLFFRVSLGQTQGVPFFAALDRSPEGDHHDLLYIDRDRDLDLTNDGAPVKARMRVLIEFGEVFVEFLNVRLELPYSVEGKPKTEPYYCVFYYHAKGKKTPTTVQVERDGWRQGRIEMGGKAFFIAVVDDDCDGKFTTGDSWALRPAETPIAELLGREATRAMLFPGWSTDQKWIVEVKEIDLSGSKLKVNLGPAKETEKEFFLRIYRARQNPEERQLKIDPMRPKADPKAKVDWIPPDKGVKYALEIGASPNVKKRVLLDFGAPNCIWCARMGRFTFRDREVVQLCKNFVCAKVLFTEAAGDSGKYNVSGTPTYIVLENDGTEVTRQEGFARPTEFAAWLKSALK